MNDRYLNLVQQERMAAIDEYTNELCHYMCNVKKIYREKQWREIMRDVRERMFHGRDLNRERIEPITTQVHCAGYTNGKCCTKRANHGAYCKIHATKAEKNK